MVANNDQRERIIFIAVGNPVISVRTEASNDRLISNWTNVHRSSSSRYFYSFSSNTNCFSRVYINNNTFILINNSNVLKIQYYIFSRKKIRCSYLRNIWLFIALCNFYCDNLLLAMDAVYGGNFQKCFHLDEFFWTNFELDSKLVENLTTFIFLWSTRS